MSDRSKTGGFDASGIDEDAWTELERQLEATIPVYDRVNRIMTLGFDKGMRKHVRTENFGSSENSRFFGGSEKLYCSRSNDRGYYGSTAVEFSMQKHFDSCI